jgi:hypothetical protein
MSQGFRFQGALTPMVFLVALILVITAPSARATSEFLGLPASQSTTWATNANYWSLFKLSPSSSAIITSATSPVDSVNATGYQVLMFTDNGGAVGGLVGSLAQSNSGSASVTYSGSVTLYGGCTYWIGIKGSSPGYLANPFVYFGAQTSPWSWTTTGLNRALTENNGTSFAYDGTSDNVVGLTLSGTATADGPCPGSTGSGVPPAQYALGFDANGGTCTTSSSGQIVDGTWIRVPTAGQCSRPGFTLLGWNPRADGGDPLGFDPGGWTVMTGDNTLYAIWVPNS